MASMIVTLMTSEILLESKLLTGFASKSAKSGFGTPILPKSERERSMNA